MRITNQLVVILLISNAVSAQPGFAIRRGTIDFDGSCYGYPEEFCGGPPPPMSMKNPSITTAPTCLSTNPPKRAPFPFRIMVSSAISSRSWLASADRRGPTRIDFRIPSAWVTAGVWTEDGGLLLVDSGRGELLRLQASGQLTPVNLGSKDLLVSDIRTTDVGMLVKLRDGRLVSLDGRGKFQKTLELLSAGEEMPGVRGVFNWIPFGNSLLAFGDALTSASTWISGWMRIPLSEPTAFTMITSAALDSLQRRIYVLGNSYVASDGSTAYILVPDEPLPQLLRISQSGDGFKQKSLQGFQNTSVPYVKGSLPLGGGREAFVARFEALERIEAPVGLYVQGGSLYLLIRRPALKAGQTEWELARLDKNSGRILNRVTLPTRANHLVVIPGREHWAFIEKGNVQAFGQQDVMGLLLISANWINQVRGSNLGIAITALESEPKSLSSGISTMRGLPSP